MPFPEEEEPQSGAPGWVVTYADMMTLLLAFFVLLFSISEIKEDRGNAMMQSLQRTFGRDQASAANELDPESPLGSPLAQALSAGRSQRGELLQNGGKAGLLAGATLSKAPAVTPSDPGIRALVVFPENSAQLTEPARRALEQLVTQLASSTQPVDIRGLISPAAANGTAALRTPWDLAYARCRTTLEYLVSRGVPPERLRLLVEDEPAGPQRGAVAPVSVSGRVEVALRPTPPPQGQDSPQTRQAQAAAFPPR